MGLIRKRSDSMATEKNKRGRPLGRKYPPRIDATPDEMARAMLSGWPEETVPKTYACSNCGREVSYPETLYDDGRCEDCWRNDA